MNERIVYSKIPSPWGDLIVLYQSPWISQYAIKRIVLPFGNAHKRVGPFEQECISSGFPLYDVFESFFSNGRLRFNFRWLDLRDFTDFERHVLFAVSQVRKGSVASYKEIAYKTGNPDAMRAIGNVMAKNHFPLWVPCHRIINADGYIGNFQYGHNAKIELLRWEGLMVDTHGRVTR